MYRSTRRAICSVTGPHTHRRTRPGRASIRFCSPVSWIWGDSWSSAGPASRRVRRFRCPAGRQSVHAGAPNSNAVTVPPQDRLYDAYSAGADRVGQEFRDARDRFVASDPGWARLRQGVRAITAVGTTLLLEYGLATICGPPPVLALL